MKDVVDGSHIVVFKSVHDPRTGAINDFRVVGVASHVTAVTFVVTYSSGAMELIHRADNHWSVMP